MKIITNNASHLCKCRSCESILEVNPSDLKWDDNPCDKLCMYGKNIIPSEHVAIFVK